MSITIKDIAKKANVSPSTVSRALNDNPHISTETTNYIQKLAKEMGYIPSEVARSLVGQRSATIGVAIADFHDPFYASMLSGIEDVAITNNHDLFVGSFYRDRKRERKLFDAFDEKRLAGIIVSGSLVDQAYLSRPIRSIPAVLVNCPSYPISVSVDQSLGARRAMEHLISLGHKRIAYIDHRAPSNSGTMRFSSYQTVLEEHHIPLNDSLIVAGDGSVKAGIKAIQFLLHLPDPPTAFFCYNDMTAVGVIHALHQRGFDIPADFSVIGFDDLEIAAYYHPPLTTIQQPIYELGFRSATLLFKLIQGEENIQSETLEPELIVRGSTTRAQD